MSLALVALASPPPLEAQATVPPIRDYWVYVGAESDDLLHRVRFGPEGGVLERTISVGMNPTGTAGPHGMVISPDQRYLYLTTGHGTPDGMLWKYDLETETLVDGPILLGRFPASIDVTPDGLFLFVANFNLYGEHVPSSMSAAFAPELYEIEQIELCVMPHGARSSPSGNQIYTVCMMDDQLVEVDSRSFEVSRRFSVARGREGPIAVVAAGADQEAPHHGHGAGTDHTDHGAVPHGPADCSPTWAQPSAHGEVVFVACNRGDVVVEVGVEDWALRRVMPTGRGPYNLDVTPDGRLLVVTLKQGHAVEIFDIDKGTLLASIPTSARVPHGVAISPDSRYAFVSVEGIGSEPGKVDVIDLVSFERVADVPVGRQAAGIAFWRMETNPE